MITLTPLPNFEGYSICKETGLFFSHKSNKYLTIWPNNKGYARTTLSIKGVTKQVFNHIKNVEIHGDKFGNRIPKGCISLKAIDLNIDHLDRNKMDPSISNLELVGRDVNLRRYHDSAGLNSSLPDLC